MNINEVFSGAFLKAEDLKGRFVTVTIASDGEEHPMDDVPF